MNPERLVAGLDIGSAKTTAIIAEVVGDLPKHPQIRVLGVGQARTLGMRRGVVADIEETTRSIRKAVQDAERMAGVEVQAVYSVTTNILRGCINAILLSMLSIALYVCQNGSAMVKSGKLHRIDLVAACLDKVDDIFDPFPTFRHRASFLPIPTQCIDNLQTRDDIVLFTYVAECCNNIFVITMDDI